MVVALVSSPATRVVATVTMFALPAMPLFGLIYDSSGIMDGCVVA